MDTRERAESYWQHLTEYLNQLGEEEKSPLTIEKYERDVRRFLNYVQGKEITKELAIQYKNSLLEQEYAVASINSMLVALNRFFEYMGWYDKKIQLLKHQREIFCSEKKELRKEEYLRLVHTARRQGNEKIALILETITSTGIRISELKDITGESVKRGVAIVKSKNKSRTVFLPKKLQMRLKSYIAKQNIQSGSVFKDRSGKEVNRSLVWRKLKELCQEARVNAEKVFPHNLRHLFAKTYYEQEKDIAKLADLLGHSNIETTRIYILSSGREHRKQIEKLGLLL